MTNKDLYDSQVEMLKTFYERDLLTQEQYEYELNVLKTKMRLDDWLRPYSTLVFPRLRSGDFFTPYIYDL